MSFPSSEVSVRDFVSRFDPSGLGAEESLGLLDDCLEVAKHFKPHGFSCDKAEAGSSEWLAVDGLCIKEEDAPLDDSGLCMSPDSSLGSPQHSPSTSRGSPNKSLLSPGALGGSSRPKPYDPPGEKMVAAKVKGEKLDKKLQKMEQNKTAATRYRQKKRAEQEALTGECKELERRTRL
uniref:Uncharacterized protein n=1 Tax=Rangifer tarandus platyrhynchus TaxID=3082113 RepID=A0ACB0EM27_RANTA|nr:unnamed protein product [Rangifer tarandus platyrhynchus]